MAKICVDTLELCDLVAGKNIFSEFWKKRKNERTRYRKKKKHFQRILELLFLPRSKTSIRAKQSESHINGGFVKY